MDRFINGVEADGHGNGHGNGNGNGNGKGNGNGNGNAAHHDPATARAGQSVVVPTQRDGHGHELRLEAALVEAHPVSPRKPQLTTSIVIPTLNEAGNIATVLRQLEAFEDIVLVDGFSADGTVDIARGIRPDITVVQRRPRGKGDALRAGFDVATGDVVVIMDADGSMDPGEVDVFTSMIAVGFDLVKGSRLACGGGSHDLTTVRLLGNAALCKLANVLFGVHWTDLCYGYLAFRRSCLPQLALTADGFEIESQILGHAALAGLRIAEIPSIEMPRLTGDSHLNATRDGTRILRAMVTARFAPRARRSAVALRPMPEHR